MREIVTLQLGNLSNYVATHFWNAQESYFTYDGNAEVPVNHDVHWRAGIGADGSDTFLPRTVVYDLKGGFGSLRKINPLYDAASDSVADAASSSLWSGPSKIHKQQQLDPSAYQRSLDEGTAPAQLTSSSVRYWSDFSRVYYHPKSLVPLYEFELHSPTMPFDRFSMGTELFGSLNKDHDIVDRDWRPFVEECDNMQGIQVFSSMDDGWGGFASSYLEAMRDEYPKSCIWVWGLQSPFLNAPRARRIQRLGNAAQTLHQACTHASMVVPLAIPEVGMPSNTALDPRSSWNVSAMLATAIESGTLQSRLNPESDYQPTSLGDMAECLNVAGNQTLARMQMAVGPNAAADGDTSLDVDLFQLGRESSKTAKREQLFGQISSVRGSDPKANDDDTRLDPTARNVIGNPVVRRYTSKLAFPLLDSYPHIYTNVAAQDKTPVRTVLSSDKVLATRVKALKSQVAWSIGVDERENLANGLSEIADAYLDDWSSGSDEDDDDL